MKIDRIILLFALCSLQVVAQQQEISQEQIIEQLVQNNKQLAIAQQQTNQAQAQYQQSRAVFLPNLNVSYTGFTTTNPLMAFGSKLNQEILTQNDFNPDLLNNPKRTTNFATRIEIKQPLFNLDGIYKRQAANSTMQAIQYQAQHTQNHLVLEAQKAYMQLQLAYKAVEVLETALEMAQQNQANAQNNFEQGYLQRADVLEVEVSVSEIENQLQQAKSNVQNASDYISFLMGSNANNIWIPSTQLSKNTLATNNAQTLNENRADIQAMNLAKQAHQKMNKANQMTFLPRLNAFGSYELYDSEFFKANANGYLVGAQLSWDLLQGGKRRGEIEQTKSQLEQARLELEQHKAQSQLEINRIHRQLTDLQSQLHRSQLAVEQSLEALRIRTNRFEQGLEKTSDVLQAQTQYAQKQLEYLQTVFEYNFAQAYLQFLTQGE